MYVRMLYKRFHLVYYNKNQKQSMKRVSCLLIAIIYGDTAINDRIHFFKMLSFQIFANLAHFSSANLKSA